MTYPELLSVAQVAERCGITRRAVLARIERGTMPAKKVGRDWFVESTEEALNKERSKAGRPKRFQELPSF